ncbi:MAG: formyl transferase [Nocardioides sp.]|nr:formyl transferase [Nocardioides sp.]
MSSTTSLPKCGEASAARRLRILLLCSAFNGLSQRAWVELREAGHWVERQLAGDADAVRAKVEVFAPDLVICPFLKERVPVEVWSGRPTIVIHPGPRGDRGPSSLDWAVMDAEPTWGVTALQAIEEMDAGPIWGSRSFSMPEAPPRKSDLYNGAVTDAALELVHEVAAKAADPGFEPEPLDYRRPEVTGRLRRPVRRADRSFSWSDPTEHVLRRIRAADGSPGVSTRLLGQPVAVFDAHKSRIGGEPTAEPGTVIGRHHGAVEVATGDGAIWLGHLRPVRDEAPQLKLPATTVLGGLLEGVPEAPDGCGYREIDYRRDGEAGEVGVLSFDFYNGAMSTGQCRRLEAAVRHAVEQDTQVLVLRGGTTFSNGIHLAMIEAAADPAAEAWANITAIDDVCRQIITCTRQLVVTALAGNAGAGGVMLALGADRVIVRQGVVLNPHYRTMGLYGSEYWTYVLPRRVGARVAAEMTTRCDPIGAAGALRTGLADMVVPDRADFDLAVTRYAERLAHSPARLALLEDKRSARAADERRKPLEEYRRAELNQMWRDIVDDEHGFTEARRAFLLKRPARSTSCTHTRTPLVS